MEQGKYHKLITSEQKGFRLNLKEVFKYKDLIYLLVRRDFVSRYKQTILGPAWAVIQPLLTTVVFTFVFGNIAGLADSGAVPTFLFYMCGNVTWALFSGCITTISTTFIANSGVMGKVYFPRLCVPISTMFSQFISLGIQMAMFLVFMVIYLFVPGYSIQPNLWILMFPVLILQMALLGFGFGIIISALTTKYRDLQFLVGFGVSLWMYATPVAYSMKIFEGSIIYQICRFNPITPIIEMVRFGFLGPDAGRIDLLAWVISFAVTIIITIIGIGMFNRVERTFMDTV